MTVPSVALERLLHERQRRFLVALLRHEALQDFALLVDRASQVDHLAIELHVHLIEMPPPMTKASHAVSPLTANVAREQRAESVPPEAHRLMADVDPTLMEQILDVAQ